VYHKQLSPGSSQTYDEAVEEAICFGWIDSTVRKVDEHRYRQLFTPRKPGSTWSRVNKERIERLEAAGLMAEPGAAKIAAAKADGSWTILDAVEALIVPDDLATALAAVPGATEGFDAFAPSVKKPYLYWLVSAKRPGTREKRIAEVVERSLRGLRPDQKLA